MMKKILLLLAMTLALTISAASRGQQGEHFATETHRRGDGGYTRIYLFGVATTFNDSIVIQTEIQQVDSAYVSRGNVLTERPLYSYQLEYYLETAQHKPGAMVAVYWDTDRRQVEHLFMRVRCRFNDDPTTHLVPLPATDFQFIKVEHVEIN